MTSFVKINDEKRVIDLETYSVNVRMFQTNVGIGRSYGQPIRLSDSEWIFELGLNFLRLHLTASSFSPVYANYEVTFNGKIYKDEQLFMLEENFVAPSSIYTKSNSSIMTEFPILGLKMTIQKTLTRIHDDSSSLPLLRKLVDDFDVMMKDHSNSDLTVKAADGEPFKVHQNVLAARCIVFKNMMSHDFAEKKTNCISIPDFSRETISHLLQYIYTSKVPTLDTKLFRDLLRAADKYALDDLKVFCANYLKSNLSLANAIDILLLADCCSCRVLKETALQFISVNQSSFKPNQFSVLEAYPRLLIEVLMNNAKQAK